MTREKMLSFIFSGGRNRLREEAALFVLEEWRSGSNDDDPFTAGENAAINGRIAASRSRYNEALLFFRITINDSPELFFQYPDLLADLGRTFQYTSGGSEGINLFLEWEKIAEENNIRYLLLFYSGRIARQRGENSAEFFAEALPLAPQTPAEQADSCIWYILDSAFADGSAAVIAQLETYIPQWRDDTYFSDILDKLARELILRRQWDDIFRVFALVRNHSNAAAAKYAWIIGRAMEEGLLSPEETTRAESMLSDIDDESAVQAFKRLAYNAGTDALYYRYLSAAALGEPFLVLPKTLSPEKKHAAGKKNGEGGTETMIFLLGFFENNAGEFASRYIRAEEDDLSIDDLRCLAEALARAGQYQESMRLISLCGKKDGYHVVRRDLELWYPRHYKELVEKYAGETGIEQALLYGLIRTESAFDSNAVSRAGAIGLTQLMPATADEEAARIRRRGGPDYAEDLTVDLRDPASNIHIGASYLAFLNERMGDPLLAVLAYNGGMNRVRRWRSAASGLPTDIFLETVEYAETRNYGRDVTAAAAVYRELYYK